ncbi:phospholipase C/P1 nuclease domain-containing protein [Mycena olivaceomarginata]|nr:phospholipase C/P1 nuclease domain-containing protein [Mycena olivaceomarginata]
MFPKIPALCTLAGLTTSAVAWGAAGHEIVATLAQIHLHPSVFPTMCAILNFTSPCHLAPIATWADTARPKMPWSGRRLSLANLRFSRASWLGRQGRCKCSCWDPHVTDILTDWVYFNKGGAVLGHQYDAANEALKFLVHFLGDMHMPLHLTGRDRGGNLIPVFFDGRKTNLHSLWDDFLIAKALRSVPSQYSRPLPSPKIEQALRGTIYDSYVRMIMWEGVLDEGSSRSPTGSRAPFHSHHTLAAWNRIGGTDDRVVLPVPMGKAIHALNCEIVWPAALDQPPYNDTRPPGAMEEQEFFSFDEDSIPFVELDTPQYSGVISEQRIVEKLLAQAGLRLAGVINYLFAELEGDEERLSV